MIQVDPATITSQYFYDLLLDSEDFLLPIAFVYNQPFIQEFTLRQIQTKAIISTKETMIGKTSCTINLLTYEDIKTINAQAIIFIDTDPTTTKVRQSMVHYYN